MRRRPRFAGGLSGLDVDVGAAVVARAAAVHEVAEREQGRGLPGLARRVQDEVALVLDEREDLPEVPALQRGHAVVPLRLDGARGVELSHGGKLDVIRCRGKPGAFVIGGHAPDVAPDQEPLGPSALRPARLAFNVNAPA